MNVRTTKLADRDIIDIYVQGAGHFGVMQAERYHAGLLALFDLLAANPRLARLRPDFTPPLRLHTYGAHMVIYTEDKHGVLIVRVLHGRQDWERALSVR